MLLIGRERGKGRIGKIPGPSPSKSGKSQKNRESPKKDKKGHRESPKKDKKGQKRTKKEGQVHIGKPPRLKPPPFSGPWLKVPRMFLRRFRAVLRQRSGAQCSSCCWSCSLKSEWLFSRPWAPTRWMTNNASFSARPSGRWLLESPYDMMLGNFPTSSSQELLFREILSAPKWLQFKFRLKNVIVSVIFAKLIRLGIPRCNCNQRVFPRNCYISRESLRLGVKKCNCNCNHQKINSRKQNSCM